VTLAERGPMTSMLKKYWIVYPTDIVKASEFTIN